MQKIRIRIIAVTLVGVALLVSSSAQCPSHAQSQLVQRQKRELFPTFEPKNLPDDSKELAAQLEILPFLEELYGEKSSASVQRRFLLSRKIQETILEAYFDAMSVQAEADREVGRLTALQELLSSRRDRAVELNNATNFIASGTLNTIGSILGFSDNIPPFPGNFNQMMSGVVSTGMSMYALKQNAGGRVTEAGNSTILAELFGRPSNSDTSYPESVWRYFHSPSSLDPAMSRAELMEKLWISRGHLERHGSPREKLKLDMVCGVPLPKNAKITMDDLADQISMISHVARIAELMTDNLRDLLRMIDSDIIFPDVKTDQDAPSIDGATGQGKNPDQMFPPLIRPNRVQERSIPNPPASSVPPALDLR